MNNKEIDNIFINVRNAYRLLISYQERIISIVNYIREQAQFTEMLGGKSCFSNVIKQKKSEDRDYASLGVSYKDDISALDYLYGYFFEYYFSYREIKEKKIEMSIFQVSDDGYFISNKIDKQITNISSYEDSGKSHSYIILNVSIYSLTDSSEIWLKDPNHPEEDYKAFLSRFLGSQEETIITQKGGNYTILKKYSMHHFTSQIEADKVISDFAKLVKDKTGVEFFKSNYYFY